MNKKLPEDDDLHSENFAADTLIRNLNAHFQGVEYNITVQDLVDVYATVAASHDAIMSLYVLILQQNLVDNTKPEAVDAYKMLRQNTLTLTASLSRLSQNAGLPSGEGENNA